MVHINGLMAGFTNLFNIFFSLYIQIVYYYMIENIVVID